MKRTNATGSVGGAFVDEVPGVTTGTAAIAEDANMIQEELAHAVEAGGVVLDPTGALDDQLAESMQRMIAERSKLLGELFFLGDLRDPSGWDRDNPHDYFAGVCLDDGDKDLAAANYPDLVPYLLAQKLTYKPGIAGEDDTFDVTNWAVAGGVATLTFANAAPELAILAALLEDEVVHGGYASWRSVTLAGAIGNILAGTYAITGITVGSRTMTFAAAVADGGAAGAWTVQFFPHAIAGSASSRVFQRAGGVLMAANDPDNEGVAGLRRRDRLQGHEHETGAIPTSTGSRFDHGTAHITKQNAAGDSGAVTASTDLIVADDTNGTPRTGKSTDPRNLVAHLYVWARRYVP